MIVIKSLKCANGVSGAFFRLLSAVNYNYAIEKSLQLNQPRLFSCLTNIIGQSESNGLTLKPTNFSLIPSCGMRVREKLQLRCKNCYIQRVDGRLYVNCTSYPRHKQMILAKKEKYTWIITSCSQSKLRPY